MQPMRGFVLVLLPLLWLTCGFADDRKMWFPGDEWAAASPQSEGVDPKRLAEAIEYLERHAPRDGVQQLMIVRRGRVIHAGPKVDEVHGIWSCTKSFTSTVLGLLVDDGKCSLDTRAAKHLDALRAQYPDVTLRHFTTMTSGYRAVGDEPRAGYVHGPSTTPFVPGEPLFAPPGSRYAYWDSAMNQFAHVLTRIAGEPVAELFRRRIAGPIGMRAGQWKWGEFAGVDGPAVNGGAGNQGRHVFISAREMARLGHLFLNKGEWDGKRLISAGWVEQATRPQVPASVPLGHPGSAIPGPGMYGYNWWVNGVKPDGARKWPGIPAGAFSASGHNNNDLFVIPTWDMVVVRLGLDEGGAGGFSIPDETYATFLRKLGESLTVP
jgi:CubicO group peptidase (beta-lactamase class C family)